MLLVKKQLPVLFIPAGITSCGDDTKHLLSNIYENNNLSQRVAKTMDVALSLAPKAHAAARRTCPLRRSNESIPKPQNVNHSPTERETRASD